MGINNELKGYKVQMDELYNRIAEESREAHIKELKPGDSLPVPGRIYGQAYQEQFNEEAAGIREKVRSLIGAEKKRVSKEMTKAPTPEAVNSISLMKLRTDLTEDDINRMIDQYGDNYGCYKAIQSIARENNIRGIEDHKYDVACNGLDFVLRKAEENFSTTHYLKEGITFASTEGFKAIVDQELPK